MEFFNSELFIIYLLPVIIFLARIFDVTIGTIRIIMISKGMKYLAPVLGFFEVLSWILVIGKLMQHVSGFGAYVAYAAGFATGNFIGMKIEERVALGHVVLRVITSKPAMELINNLNKNGFGATYIDAYGSEGQVNIIFSIIKRKALNEVLQHVKQFNENAFYTVEDIRSVGYGIFPEISKKTSIFSIRGRSGK